MAIGAGATAAAGVTAAGAGSTIVSVGVAAAGAGAASAGTTAAGALGGSAGALGAGATATGAAAGVGAEIAVAAVASTAGAAIAVVATGAAIAVPLLEKYGLKPRPLDKSNMMDPEADAKRMVSQEMLRVKHAPDMGLVESIRHLTFLLSDENLQYVKRGKVTTESNLKKRIHRFNTKTEEMFSTFSSEAQAPPSSATIDAVTTMFNDSVARKASNASFDLKPIDKIDRHIVNDKAQSSLAWAHDPARPVVPGSENMTKDQAAAIMLYTQESCLYSRLNAALRNHDMRSLEPFLPYIKLLLSGLYHLPLTHVRTYRGVKLEIFETYNLLIGKVWSWWSFSSTTRDKDVLDTPLFLGNDGKRTLFCMNAAGVDIASFSAMPGEEEVLLLPGLPLVNFPGENPEPDLWTFEVETPGESVATGEDGAPPVMIDYVHPGWNSAFHDKSWQRLSNTHIPLPGDL